MGVERLRRRLDTPADGDGDEDGEDQDASLSRWLPDGEPGTTAGWLATIRADPGRAGAVALAVVGVIAVLVTVFTLVRDEKPPVVAAKLPPVQMVSSASPSPGPGVTPSARPDQPLVVSEVGVVHKPGLVTLTTGARIAAALTAAGGPLDGADLAGMNMARRLVDGEQVIVGIAPSPGDPAGMASSVSSGSTATANAGDSGNAAAPSPPVPLDLNTASVEQFNELPGVGPVTAGAIVAWRDAKGRFTGVDQLGDVDGIGPARLDKLRDLVHV